MWLNYSQCWCPRKSHCTCGLDYVHCATEKNLSIDWIGKEPVPPRAIGMGVNCCRCVLNVGLISSHQHCGKLGNVSAVLCRLPKWMNLTDRWASVHIYFDDPRDFPAMIGFMSILKLLFELFESFLLLDDHYQPQVKIFSRYHFTSQLFQMAF